MDLKCNFMRQVCQACLSINNPTEPINSELTEIYNTMGVDINSVPFPVAMCVNCRYLMKRYNAFRTSCLNANRHILWLFKSNVLTLENVETARNSMRPFMNLSLSLEQLKVNAPNINSVDIIKSEIEDDSSNTDNKDLFDYESKDFELNDIIVEPLDVTSLVENEQKPTSIVEDTDKQVNKEAKSNKQSPKSNKQSPKSNRRSPRSTRQSPKSHKQSPISNKQTSKSTKSSKQSANSKESTRKRFEELLQSDDDSLNSQEIESDAPIAKLDQQKSNSKESNSKQSSYSKLKQLLESDDESLPQDVDSDAVSDTFSDLKEASSDESVKLTKKETKKVKRVRKRAKKTDHDTNKQDTCKERGNRLNEEDQLYFNECIEVKKLSLSEQIQEFEKRKLNKVYRMATYKCELCYTGFIVEDRYDLHMERHRASDPNNEMCNICKRYFRDRLTLKKHIQYHTQLSMCKKCDFTSVSRTAAVLHMRWHKGTVYKCEQCPSEFMRTSSLLSHIRIAHTSDYVCVYCGYAFVGERGLMKHIAMKHKNCGEVPSDGPRCDICSITFLDESALQAHLLVSPKHGVNKRNVDQSVEKKRRLSNLNTKTESYAKNLRLVPKRNISCEKCDAVLRTRFEYMKHFREAHPCDPTRFKYSEVLTLCEICGKVLKSQHQLKDHMTEHFKEQAPIHKCDLCNKSFRKRAVLYAHRKLHKGIRYPCPLCQQTFTLRSNRDRHFTYVHSDSKEHKCDYCDKYFKTADQKNYHTNHVHLNKPWPKRDRTRRKTLGS